MQAIQGIPQQQIQVAGDRPVMPVVSMPAQPNQQQAMQQAMPATIQQGLPLQSNLAVTQQASVTDNIQSATIPGTAPTQPSNTTTSENGLSIAVSTQQGLPLQSGLPVTQQASMNDNLQSASIPGSAPTQPSNTTASENGLPIAVSMQQGLPLQSGLAVTQQASINDNIQSAAIPGTVPSQPAPTASENGLPIAVTAEEVKERCPPKAMIKPQVLTHVIEDFVIQESSEPFPVRLGLLGDYKPTQSSTDKESDEPPRKYSATVVI